MLQTFKRNMAIVTTRKHHRKALLLIAKKHLVPLHPSIDFEERDDNFPNLHYGRALFTDVRATPETHPEFNWLNDAQFIEYCENWGKSQPIVQLNKTVSGTINRKTETVIINGESFDFETLKALASIL